jgi:hypothetical protein
MLGIIARLGHVIYWLGCAGAVLSVLFGLGAIVFGLMGAMGMGSGAAHPFEAMVLGPLVAVLYGGGSFLLGLTVRYILSGPQGARREPS